MRLPNSSASPKMRFSTPPSLLAMTSEQALFSVMMAAFRSWGAAAAAATHRKLYLGQDMVQTDSESIPGGGYSAW